MCGVFFFFKQKTAYEMRISDWSSDVCSSDLTLIGAYPDYYLRATLEAWSKSGMSVFSPAAIKEYSRAFRDPACLSASCEDYRASASIEIGRASCRERVCQYV